MKFGTTASRASTALCAVKYLFVEPSVRSLVVESATPFSAEIVRPVSSPVIVMFVFVAPTISAAAATFARTSVKYLFVPSSMSDVESAFTAVVIALLRAVTSVEIFPSVYVFASASAASALLVASSAAAVMAALSASSA